MHCVTGTAAAVARPTESLKIQHQTSACWPVSDSGTTPSAIGYSDSHDADGTWAAIRRDTLEAEVGRQYEPSRNRSIDPRRQYRLRRVGLVLVGNDTSRPRDVYICWADEESPPILKLGVARDIAGPKLVDCSVDDVAVDDGVPRELKPAHISCSIALVVDPQRAYALSAGDHKAGFQFRVR